MSVSRSAFARDAHGPARRRFGALGACLLLAGSPRIALAADQPATPPAARLTEMGRFFETSEPPSQDLAKARDLYCRAATAGDAEALQRLGWIYFKGRGVAANEQVAATLFGWAAELGDGQAAGLANATRTAVEAPPPCLANAGITSLHALRARLKSSAPPGAAPIARPDAGVDNPVAFRTLPASIEHRRIVQMVVQEARGFRLDPRLVLALIRAESNFEPLARSPKNAQGLMQLIPETAQRFDILDPLDPAQNLRAGMAYLRWLLAYYRGDVLLTLAAYNAGEGVVDRYKGVPPYAETIAYVQRIRALYPFDRHPFDSRALTAGERSWVGRDVAATAR